MKKKLNQQRNQEKPRRLTLSRETIKHLEDPALLEAVQGGTDTYVAAATTTEKPTGCT